MTHDELVLSVVLVAFATLVMSHFTIAIGLAVRPRRWRALLALVVLPLAPWWGLREKMWVRSVLWVVAAIAYAVALAQALRS